MKFLSLLIISILTAQLTSLAATPPLVQSDAAQRAERTLAAEPNVVVILCLESGNIVVRGSERREVRARSGDVKRIELRRADATVSPNPAARIEVLMSDIEGENRARYIGCNARGNIQLDVPRGAVLQLRSRNGDIDITEVAEVQIDTQNGDINLQRVLKVIEASTISGSISLLNSTGRVRLHSISGEVNAENICTAETGDDFIVKSLSGDITLSRICHTRVEAVTVNGDVSMDGPLARGGRYAFKTTSGDVTLTMPGDASFQVEAKVHAGGEIITNFPIKQMSGNNSIELLRSGRLVGVYGTDDATRATLNLSAFSGTVQLRRK